MRFPVKVTVATSAMVVAMGALAAPADAKVIRGKAGCFSYSYNNDADQTETVYWRNTCKTKRYIKIVINRGPDGCFGVKGRGKGDKKFLPYTSFTNATFKSAKQVKNCK